MAATSTTTPKEYIIKADSMTLPNNKVVRKGDVVSSIHFSSHLIEKHLKDGHIVEKK